MSPVQSNQSVYKPERHEDPTDVAVQRTRAVSRVASLVSDVVPEAKGQLKAEWDNGNETNESMTVGDFGLTQLISPFFPPCLTS
jgi:hypothetical protein